MATIAGKATGRTGKTSKSGTAEAPPAGRRARRPRLATGEAAELRRIRQLLEDPSTRRRRHAALRAARDLWAAETFLAGLFGGARRGAWRYRAALAPWVVAATAAAGLWLSRRASHPTAAGLAVAGVVAVAAVGVHDRLRGERERVVAAVTLTATAGWVAVATLAGTDGRPVRAAAVALFVGGAVPWWRDHVFGGHAPVARAAAGLALLWRRVEPKVLPGTTLIDPRPLIVAGRVVGEEAVIEAGDDSDLTTSEMIDRTEKVTGRLKASVGDVVIEPTDDARADHARILRLTVNPLHDTQWWPGGDLDVKAGTSSVGVHPDGQLAEYVWVQAGSGPWHDLFAGTTGAGKSSTIEMLLATSRAAGGAVVDWIGDPQQGQSAPDWIDHVDRSATTSEGCVLLLERAVQAMYARNELLANWPWRDEKGRDRKGFGYFPWLRVGMPLLVVTIFEAHKVFAHPRGRAAGEELGKMARKCGIKLRAEVQVPLLDQLGGSTTLRDMVAGGNVLVFRTANPLSGTVAFNGTLPVQPNRIPRAWPGRGPIEERQTGGLGYSVGGTSRTGWMRAWRLRDALDAATYGVTARLDEKTQAMAATWPPTEEELRLVADPDAVPAGPGEGTPLPSVAAAESRQAADVILDLLRKAGGPVFQLDLRGDAEAAGVKRSNFYGQLKRLKEAGKVLEVAGQLVLPDQVKVGDDVVTADEEAAR